MGGCDVSENMRAILAINAAARAAGQSYGHFVVISTREELREIVAGFLGPEKPARGRRKK